MNKEWLADLKVKIVEFEFWVERTALFFFKIIGFIILSIVLISISYYFTAEGIKLQKWALPPNPWVYERTKFGF